MKAMDLFDNNQLESEKEWRVSRELAQQQSDVPA